MKTYKVIRFYASGRKVILKRGISLDDAQKHCNSPETSSKTATSRLAIRRTRMNGAWFDGYTAE